MRDSLDNPEYSSLLYDFYGGLLRDNQREIMDLYHEDDMSLAEIAEELDQTRQGVHYTLKKAETKLASYEKELGLIAKYRKSEKRIAEAEEIILRILRDEDLSPESEKDLNSLSELIRQMSDQ